jgi:GNAT superfamily N-acetyltransferase
MFVRADWTRRGLGRRILEECESAARRAGFRQLVLGATLPGVPLYLAYGFKPLEEFEVTMPDGVTMACVSMSKPIDVVQSQSRAMHD